MLHRWKSILTGAPLFIAGMLLSITACSFLERLGNVTGIIDFIVYPWVYLSHTYNLQIYLSCIVMPGLLFLSLLVSLLSMDLQTGRQIVPKEVVLALVIANLLNCSSLMLGVWVFITEPYSYSLDLQLLHETHGSNRFIVVQSNDFAGIGGEVRPSVILFECDQIGLLCQDVFRYRGQKSSRPYLEEHALQINLLPDEENSTLAFEVNGEIVYTHVMAR